MRNIILSDRTVRDIDSKVAKVLRDMDNPEPPLCLENVRHLLKRDLQWYSSTDNGILQRTTHCLKVAGKQLLQRPTLLWEAVSKFKLQALWLPDQKQIILDKTVPKPKLRWNEAHEIGHSLIPWHEQMTHGDQQQTLSYDCHQQLEAEANFAAGRLLFLRDKFAEELLSSVVTFGHIKQLASRFGNTMTTALWRTVESLDKPCLAMISKHPKSYSVDDPELVRYFIRSGRFSREFSSVESIEVFHRLTGFCRRGNGPIGNRELLLTDDNGSDHVFLFECFHNGHDTLTLALPIGPRSVAVAMSGTHHFVEY